MVRGYLYPLLLAAPLSMMLTGCSSFGLKRDLAARRMESASSSHTTRLLNLAERYEQQGNHEGALRLYQQVVKAEPGHRLAQQRIAAIASSPNAGPMVAQAAAPIAPRSIAGTPEAPSTAPSDAAPQPIAQPAAQQTPEPAAAPTIAATPAPAPEPALSALPIEPVSPTITETTVASPPTGQVTEIAVDPAFAGTEIEESTAAAEVAASEGGDNTSVSSAVLPEWALGTGADAPELSAAWWSEDAEAESEDPAIELPLVDTNGCDPVTDWSTTSLARRCEGATPEVEALVQALESADEGARQSALSELARLREQARPALPAVIALLSDSQAVMQAQAAWTVWEISQDPENSVDPLTALLVKNDAPEVVQLSAYLLGDIGPDAGIAEDALWYICERSTGSTRLHAAEALVRIAPEDTRPVSILIEGLSEADAQNRWLSALALSCVADEHHPQAVAALAEVLDDSAPEVCIAAALTLGCFGSEAAAATEPLQLAATHESEEVRSAARIALDCITQ